ncbi:MAG: xanthine dehydrogenase family protein molybdopterin-binding subunit [Coprococcus sp.]
MKKYAGTGRGRVEGMDKATGRAKYAADYYEENMLHIALVRSPHAHARIISVDTSQVPHSDWVWTCKDIVKNNVQDILPDQPLLAEDKVRFLGEPVAVVAAETPEEAKAAAAKVKVLYDPLPVVTDALMAAQPGCIRVHENTSNDVIHFENEKGNVAEGFAVSDLIIEDDFYTPVQDHGYMEPEACLAKIDDEGRLLVYTSTQNVFHDLRMVCDITGLDASQVHIHAATVGGGFGGKDGNTAQLYPALAAWKTKRPCKLVFTRQESLATTYKRHAVYMHVKMGFKKDGKIVAFEGSGYLDTGAYGGLGPAVLSLFSEHFSGPYNIPNVKIDSHLCYTNKPVAHAMRGFGAPQGAFATEMLISRASHMLNIDPLEIRYINGIEQGDAGGIGQKMRHYVDFKGALKLIEQSELWQERKNNSDPYVGYGIAGGHLSCGLGKNIPDKARARIEEKNGHYTIYLGLVDIGQGSRTALQAMAAEELNTDFDNVTLVMADTDTTPDCGSTAGSRSTFIGGNAILDAIRRFKKGEKGMGEADFPESEESFPIAGFPHAMYTFIAQAVKLRVDPVTGQVTLLDIVAATEAGRIINPLSMAGQIQGGVAMSVGYAFGENCQFRDGRLLNDSMSTYLMPTAMDLPQITSLHVDGYEMSGPMGVKGAAEVSTVSIAPAIGAAINEVSKGRLNQLPFDIETILNGLVQ